MDVLNDLPRQTLQKIVASYGSSISDDPCRCKGLLLDHCGSCQLEISLLMSVIEEPGAIGLLVSASLSPAIQIAQVTKRLHEDQGLAEHFAHWGVVSWALAMGVIGETEARSLDALHSLSPAETPVLSIQLPNLASNAPDSSHASDFLASLMFLAGPLTGQNMQITKKTTTLGRHDANDCVIADPGVSRFHALLVQSDSGWTVSTLAPRNSLTVNRWGVEQSNLSNGDIICLGTTTTFLFHIKEQPLLEPPPHLISSSLDPSHSGNLVFPFDSPEEFLQIAQAHLQAGRIELAFQVLQHASPSNYQNALLHKMYGQIFTLRQPPQREMALQAYNHSLQINNQDADTHRLIGDIYLYMYHSPTQAIVAYTRALHLNPRDLEAHRGLGKCYEDSGQPALALHEYLEMTNLGSQRSDIYYALGQLALHLSQLPVAERAFVYLLTIEPGNYEARFMLARTYEQEGKIADALRECRHVMTAMSGNQQAQEMWRRLLNGPPMPFRSP